jgi:MYXO-CTERM domain-containing protein
MSGDTIIVGTPYEDSAAQDAGATYVFVTKNGSWTLEQKLVAPDAGAGRWFGYSVAIDGNKAIVGAPQADGNTLDAGAAYVFLRTIGMWIALPKIAATDGKPGDTFGQSVDISGNSLVVGCPNSDAKGADAGAAYVFVWNGSAYVEQKKLFPTDSKAGDHFGAAVAMDGETAIVGAPEADVFGADSGTAYIFFRGGTLWSQQKKLISPNGAAGDAFGWAVDIEADTAVVGSPLDDTADADAGAAYSFRRTGVAWNPSGNLVPQGLAADDRFGSSVAMSGTSTLVGALLDDTAGMNAGAAYIFRHNGFSWYQSLELFASDAAIGDAFGFAVAISGQTAVASAYLDDDVGTSSGSTYVYELKNESGETCVTGAECLTGFCADGTCCDTACDQGPCDACAVAAGAKFAGVCKLLDGVMCDDGDACTQTDTCLAGQCIGADSKMCSTSTTCAGTSMCDAATGMCVGPLTPDGTTCDDANACTASDVCQGGVCLGVNDVSCPALDDCHAEGTCDPASGTCSVPVLPDGTVCPGGVCRAGTCVSEHANILVTGGGCVCRAAPHENGGSIAWGMAALGGLLATRKIRRSPRSRGATA